MRTIERRLSAIEAKTANASEANSLTIEQMSALVVDQLENWYREGFTPEQIGDCLVGLGYAEDEARSIAYEFEWDQGGQLIRETDKPLANSGGQQR